jgi:porin
MIKYYFFLLSLFLISDLAAQVQADSTVVDEKSQVPFSFEASYVADMFTNMKGGIRTGSGYLGMANMCVGFNTQLAGLWKGGNIYVHGASTHGSTPSATYLGDLQAASNIEAGDHIYIQELWYSQKMGSTEWIIGAQDLNAEFVSSETGGLFLNSSFGIPSLMSYNLPVPIFPLTTLGITGKWQVNDDFSFKAALFDGRPTTFEENKYNLGWDMKKSDGMLMFTESELATNILKLPGTYKLGAFYHSGLKEKDETTGLMTSVFDYDYGFYFLGDQKVWQNTTTNRSLTLFVQASVCPENINTHHFYIGGGGQLSGLFCKNGNDILGLAVAHAGFKNMIVKHETTFELSYQLPLGDHFFVQPDVQYIMNPAGTDSKLDDALVAFCRVGINF